MAQDAELKLKVSLDLGFFRQQLAGLGQAAAGYNMPINVKFDRSVITKELRNLERALGKKKINIELNLLGGLTKDQLERIQGRLEALSKTKKVEIPVSIKNGATGKDADKVVASIKERLAQNQQIKQGGGKLRIETSVKPSITNEDIAVFKKAVKDKLSKISALEVATKLDVPKVEDLLKGLQKNINRQKPLLAKTSIKPSILSADIKAFKKAVESKLSGITVKINAELETIGGGKTKAQIEKEVLAGLERIQQMGAERMGGGVTEPARRESLRQSLQGRDIGELKDIGKQLGVAGVGKFRNTQNLIERIVTEASIEMITKYLDPQAVMRNPDRSGLNKVLDTFARGLFNMLGMDVASMRQQAAQRRALPGVNFPATVPSRPVSIGPSSTGRALSAGAGPAGMIGAAQAPVGLLPSMSGRSQTQAIVEALIAQQGPRMLPSGGGALVDTKRIYAEFQKNLDNALRRMFTVLEVSVFETGAGLKDGLDTFAYLAQALKDAEARTKQSRIAEEVDSLISRIETALRLAAARVNIRQVQIGIGASMQGALPSARVAGLLPAGVGREPSRYAMGGESREQMMARRTAEAYARSVLRGMDVMGGGAGRPPSPYSYAYRSARPTSAIIPYAQPGAIVPSPVAGEGGAVPPVGGGGGMRGMGGMGGFGRALGGVNLPGAGAIRELGGEFAFATQQVLLFGQAYKLLAFVQNFPAQVGEAVSQLQSFRNTLNSVTGSAEEAGDANEFILAAVEKYNIPLQSARDGFVKLFASMEPAGFAAGEIQNLFLGITKAAATYGLSADKVDRVNYAFAQMASKGQVMSEELKGQLGDVLPGAMGIFAEAAGFTGPDAIQKFNKALEDGVYKGGEMRKLLKNVADGMNKEFGPGAEGAAKTFQGSINRMQNAIKSFYESFEPAAIGVLNQVAVPLVNTLKNITAGINAYFQGQTAATPEAQKFANALQVIVPVISGIAKNAAIVATQLGLMAGVFGSAAIQIGRVLSLPIVGYLASTYAQVLILTTAFNFLAKSAIGAAIVAISQFIAKGIVYAQVSLGMRVATQQTTVAMYQFGTAVQTVMIKTVIGIALVAISALIAKFVELQNAMASVSGQSRQMQDAAKASAKMGDVAGVKEAIGNMEDRVQTYKKLKGELDKVIGDEHTYGFYREIPSALAGELMSLGLIVESSMRKVGAGYKVKIGDLRDAYNLATKNVSEFNKAIDSSQTLVGQAQKKNQQLKQQGVVTGAAESDPKALAKAAEEARKLADDKRKYEADLMKISSQQAINLNEMEFDHWKNLQQAKYDFLEAGQNEWMSRELKFQRDLQAIEIRRIEAIRKARIETVKAETDAQASAYVAGDSGVGGGAAMFGATGRVFNAPGWVHGHFQNMNREALVQDTVEVVMKLLQQGVKPELGSGQKFTAGMQQAQVEQLVRRGIASHKSYASGVGAIDVFVPQGTQVPVGLSGVSNLGGAAGISGNLPRGTQLMHLDPSSRSGAAGAAPAGVPASRIRAEAKKDYASALASQEAINAKEKENLATKYANIQAQQELNILIREYTASIVPVEQQKLENTLLQNRISLISSGAFGDALETEQKIGEAREKATLGMQMASAQIEQNNKLVKDGIIKQEEADKLNASQVEKIKQLTQGLEAYIPLLRERLKLEQSSAEATLRGEITRATPLGGMGLSAGFIGPASDRFEEAIGRGATQDEASRFAELQNQLTLLESRNEAIKQSIYGIGNAFGEALTTGVASLVSGTATAKEVFASFLQSVGQALSQAASQMIATYIAIGIAKMFAGLGGGGGNPAGSGGGISDSLPGIRQYAGGLGGGGAPGSMPFAPPAFANGGIVTGPTLSLIGEGKYNEAIVPLPDGRSIPVQLGGRSARDLMGNGAPGMPQAPSLSMKFETTKINGVEYVSREQLEQAMAETRRASIAGGAQRGMSMTLDKIKQSPSTRSSIGIR
jgi:tape measure domain-containing protein